MLRVEEGASRRRINAQRTRDRTRNASGHTAPGREQGCLLQKITTRIHGVRRCPTGGNHAPAKCEHHHPAATKRVSASTANPLLATEPLAPGLWRSARLLLTAPELPNTLSPCLARRRDSPFSFSPTSLLPPH